MKKSLSTLSLAFTLILSATAPSFAYYPAVSEEAEFEGQHDSNQEANAGLEQGDVILTIDGKPVRNSGLREDVVAEIRITEEQS